MNQYLTIAQASEMTARFRDNRNTILKTEYQNQDLLPLSETFHRSFIETLLQNTGCVRIRIYFGMDEELKLHAILVAADENGNDILPPETITETEEEEEEGYMVDNGTRCPPLCPPKSPLND